MNVLTWAVTLSLLAAPMLADDGASTGSDPALVSASHSAAEAYYEIDSTMAAGCESLFDCIDYGKDGAMRQRYIHPDYPVDSLLVTDQPDVLMDVPQSDGSMQLTA